MGQECCVPEHEEETKIVFGVDPKILEKVGTAVVVLKTFSFCRGHWSIYRSLCLGIIERECGGLEDLCHNSKLMDGLGCWITIGCIPEENFQLPYALFEKIFRLFAPILQRN